jgi:hypothetical protein
MSRTLLTGAAVLALIVSATHLAAGQKLRRILSPDAALTAIIAPVDPKKGYEEYESRISILRAGAVLRVHDFSSEDGEHGYGVAGARWTPDSKFFVCQMKNSGGHSPMNAPVVFWSRKTNRFYELDDYTADMTFSIVAPDKVAMNTWPGLKPVTVSLGRLTKGQAIELR